MYRIRRGPNRVYLSVFYTLRSIHLSLMFKFIYILWSILSNPLSISFVSGEDVVFVVQLTRLTYLNKCFCRYVCTNDNILA